MCEPALARVFGEVVLTRPWKWAVLHNHLLVGVHTFVERWSRWRTPVVMLEPLIKGN